MDNQDKIFNRFKEAADNAEPKDFPGMDKVWSRVEEKLDRKEDRKTISLWKKIAVAASLLLVISLGYQFFKTDKKAIIETPKVVDNADEKQTIENSNLEKSKAVVSSDSQLVTKEEAAKILDKQIKQQKKVAIQEIDFIPPSPSPVVTERANYDAVIEAPSPIHAEEEMKDEENMMAKSKIHTEPSLGYAKKAAKESFSAASAEKQAQAPRKSAPLVVLNGNAISHSDDAKRDRMMQRELPNLEPSNVESLVILDEPLYIIDGIYYSENDLFGKNPTSPYAPLNEQEIKTITILQDLEATAKYGERGKKGVVIITTKTGKPAQKK
ncbi:TonB-dependent SusC/RagA subfamily outer membrane receptor [Flavobacterium sp. HSC-32F16]|uniref:hypothetical protein n=1 Tax=Flavobacterium sp. HSC-32F16 TaxID=2910964 RepID=UPI0020A33C5D|nr:hypothetical protein [Flavobacterium sp. HSC-32F16]MCP2027599.1 TonB-dependent SusC/RagA subfamily outer membrane receptor [Flavobacterium sp. HSC-32F16]